MITYQVAVLNPKAEQILKDLADLELITLTQTSDKGFMDVVERLRAKAEVLQPPTLEEITEEVEAVRAERYAKRDS